MCPVTQLVTYQFLTVATSWSVTHPTTRQAIGMVCDLYETGMEYGMILVTGDFRSAFLAAMM